MYYWFKLWYISDINTTNPVSMLPPPPPYHRQKKPLPHIPRTAHQVPSAFNQTLNSSHRAYNLNSSQRAPSGYNSDCSQRAPSGYNLNSSRRAPSIYNPNCSQRVPLAYDLDTSDMPPPPYDENGSYMAPPPPSLNNSLDEDNDENVWTDTVTVSLHTHTHTHTHRYTHTHTYVHTHKVDDQGHSILIKGDDFPTLHWKVFQIFKFWLLSEINALPCNWELFIGPPLPASSFIVNRSTLWILNENNPHSRWLLYMSANPSIIQHSYQMSGREPQ